MLDRREALTRGLTAAGLCLLSLRAASAQSKYPDRPIRLIVPFAPGGVNDAAARPWAEKMRTLLGTIVVENIGGGGGSIGAAAAAHAAPDGYTILLGGGATHVINPLASTRSLYDPLKDFDAVALMAFTGLGITVHPSVPAQTLPELIAYAKANPGKLSYGSAGAGSPSHLGGELFKSLIGTADIPHIAYRGAGPAQNDLVAGHVPLLFPSMTGHVLELYRAGKLRLLAVTTPQRMVAAPEIPTAVEAGLPGMVSQSFVGLFTPAGTPQPIVDQIAQATHAALAETEYQDLLRKSGFEPYLESTPQRARQFVEQEIERWRPLIRSIGLQLQ